MSEQTQQQANTPVPMLKERSITRGEIDLAVRDAIERIDSDSSQAEVLELHDWINEIARMARTWKSEMEQAFIGYLEAAGEEGKPAQIQTGTIRHYVGKQKSVKARDSEAVLETLLDVSGGDVGLIDKCLSSNAWKHGEVRSVLEQAGEPEGKFSELFETVEKPTLKDGKPNKKLVTVDEQFTPNRKGNK